MIIFMVIIIVTYIAKIELIIINRSIQYNSISNLVHLFLCLVPLSLCGEQGLQALVLLPQVTGNLVLSFLHLEVRHIRIDLR